MHDGLHSLVIIPRCFATSSMQKDIIPCLLRSGGLSWLVFFFFFLKSARENNDLLCFYSVLKASDSSDELTESVSV